MFVERILQSARERLALIDSNALVTQAAELMSRPHTDLVIVCGRDGKMARVLTKTDIVGQIRQCTGCGCAAQIESIMTHDVVACRPDDRLEDVWSTMMRQGASTFQLSTRAACPWASFMRATLSRAC